MIESYAKELPARVRGFVRESWGAPFIVGFMLLLVVAAASLPMGLVDLANGAATAGYCALVVGVILQLVCFLKYNKRNGEED
jgi:hypothetical protein